jgi:hypothetical protein
MPKPIVESVASASLVQADPGAAVPTKHRVRIIEGDRWGSSGYYSREVLESAAQRGVFSAGLASYIDHPGKKERVDRPERSIRDLAGTFSSNAVYEADNPEGPGLYADLTVYSHLAPVINEIKDNIGLSIRAAGEVTEGEAQGRRGPIITEITEAFSVDLVTAAGAGGKFISLLESAQDRFAALTETTVDDRRTQLQQKLPERSYVSTYDPDKLLVYYIAWGRDGEAEKTYQQSYTVSDDGRSVTLNGQPEEVRAVTQYVPVSSAGQTTTTESEEDSMPEIEEAKSALAEAQKRVAALEAERDQLQEALAASAKALADRLLSEAATEQIEKATKDLNEAMADRVKEKVLSKPLPVADDKIDEAKLAEAITAAVDAEKAYAEALNPKTLAGFGASTPADSIQEAQVVSPWGRKNTKEA